MKQNSNANKAVTKADLNTLGRNLGALIEDTNKNVRAIAEQMGGVLKTLNSHTDMLNSHTEMIGNVLVSQNITKTNIEFIKADMKKYTVAEEFRALEKRVSYLEKKAMHA